MPELMTLLAEAKTNLHDLENLLQKARALNPGKIVTPLLTREEFQGYFEDILRIVEKIPENLNLEDSFQWKTEIRRLHLDMDEARNKVEYSLDRLESICERNVKQLSQFIEALESRVSSKPAEDVMGHSIDSLAQLMSQGREYLENGDHESCMKLMQEILSISPNHEEASSCLKEAQRKWEDHRLEEELAIHIENLKKEAMNLFDREKFKECVGMFRFLCELDPKNHCLQDYLQLSRLKLEETEETASKLQEQAAEKPESVVSASIQSGPVEPGSDLGAVASIETMEETSRYPDVSLQTQDEHTDPLVSREIPEESYSVTETIAGEYTPELHLTSEVLEKEESTALVSGKFDTEPIDEPKPQRAWLVLASVACMLLGALIGVYIFHLTRAAVGTLEVQSDPEGAKVYIDGQFKGLTPFQANSLQAGNYAVRLERDGYSPEIQTLPVNAGAPAQWSVVLRTDGMKSMSSADLQKTAQELFDREKFLEASAQCDLILGKEPSNELALSLKNKIADHYWQEFRSAQQIKYWENARLALANLLKVAPQNIDALNQLKNLNEKPKKKNLLPPSSVPDLKKTRIDELHRQIATALSAGNYYPPASGNAIDLMQQLTTLSPQDGVAKSGMGEVQRESLNQIQKKIQGKDYEAARSLARQFQNYFPGNTELSRVQETLKAEESRQFEARNELIRKAEAALMHGNYVTPASESVLAYSNRLLALDRQNPRAQALRRDSLQKATEQANELVQKERFDEARGILTVLHTVAQSDGKPAVAQELKGLLDRIEFTAVPVVHDHTIGSCSGRLRMNGFVITYLPSGDSKDGFSQKLSEIVEIDAGEKLKIQLKNKAYRFQVNSSKNKEDNRQKLKEISDQLNRSMEQANQNSRATPIAHRISE